MCYDRHIHYTCGHRRHVQTLCEEYNRGRGDLYVLRATGQVSRCPGLEVHRYDSRKECPRCLERMAAEKRQRRREKGGEGGCFCM